ncbi:SNF2 family N-terminal domain-containing protein [Limtongia smithiae]|uniref:SNF2 family N-terminal domain-containing protein n=1 Tax=Limtongia smithiae TaxID=1125753 RepID=UPI0034CD7D5A
MRRRDAEIAGIMNNLDTFVPLGVVDTEDIPRLPAPGITAPDGWMWIAPPAENSGIKLIDLLESIAHMYEHRLLRVTYMMLDGHTARFRIYMVPLDMRGRARLPAPRGHKKGLVKHVLTNVNTATEAWFGIRDAPFIPIFPPVPKECPTLLELFNDITAANIDTEIDDPETEEIIREVMTGHIQGMRSTLYQYQRETVVEMLKKELVPQQIMDPRLIEVQTPLGKTVYLDTDTYELQVNPARFDGPFGGILSEEMGFGKTCICIALICATKNQGSRLPENYLHMPTEARSVPSLARLCAKKINNLGLPWRSYQSRLPQKCIDLLIKHRGFYNTEERSRERLGRNGLYRSPETVKRTVMLSGTTLVICPLSLVPQWQAELDKHVQSGFLSVLCYFGTLSPDYKHPDFSRYDVVIMSQQRFSSQFKQDGSTVHNIRWKRIIVDEGHSLGKSRLLSSFAANNIHVDRKWAVTGTPVPGLLGINTDDPQTQHVNTHKEDLNDLSRLGHIVSNFLNMPPWSIDDLIWRRYCSRPFIDEKRYGVVQLILSQVMVRHKWTDLKVDVQLPPLIHKTVLLHPTLFDKININLFHSFVAVNAVSSDRVDQDYLFHKRNSHQLHRLITNLQHSTFYWTGFSSADIKFMMEVADNCLTNKKTYDEDDISLLHNALKTGRVAMENEIWRFASTFHEMGYFTSDMPVESTSFYDLELSHGRGLVSGSRILRLQRAIGSIKQLDSDGNVLDDEICRVASEIETEKFAYDAKKAAVAVAAAAAAAEKAAKGAAIQKELELRAPQIFSPKPQPALHHWERERLPGMPEEKKRVTKKSPINATKTYSSNNPYLFDMFALRISPESQYYRTNIDGTVSAKLTYLLSRILELQEEKSIIFYQFEDAAFYIGEALEILGIEHCFYTTTLNSQARATNLMTFNSEERYRVMIMDLNLAAHGLDVTGASHIFFVNPVWQPNIEAQAMRRAHRIGQTRPVYVETLVLRGTIEQQMFDRRKAMTQHDFQVAKTLMDDEPINHIISTANFLDLDDGAVSQDGIKAPLLRSSRTAHES